MSLAARTREAARERPWLVDALAAGVVNYTAAARSLEIEGGTDAVATALGRYAEELRKPIPPGDGGRVRMRSGVDLADTAEDAVLAVGDTGIVDGGDRTVLIASGVDAATALERCLGRLRVEGIDVEAAGWADGTLAIVVDRREGPKALRLVEGVLG